MKIRNRIVALLLSASILTVTTGPSVLLFADETQEKDIQIYVVPNTMAIRKNDTQILGSCNSNLELSLSAAANERESGQIVINSKKDIGKITIEKNDLTCGANKIKAENIEVFFERYVNIVKNAFWLCDMESAYQADPLLPYDIAQQFNLNELDTSNGNNQGIWFTVKVPSGTLAGDYEGDFKIILGDKCDKCDKSEKCDNCNKEEKELKVKLKVYNFELPSQTQSKTFFNDSYAQNNKSAVYTDMASCNNTDDYANGIKDLCNERKISTGWTGCKIKWNELGKIDKETSEYKKLKNNTDRQKNTNMYKPFDETYRQFIEDYTEPKNNYMESLDSYTEAILKYVNESKTPYYNIEPSENAAQFTKKFDNYTFDLTSVYDANKNIKTNINSEEVKDEISGTKFKDIKDIFGSIKSEQSNTALTTNEEKAIEFAVNTYLYFDIKYCTGILSVDELKYITDAPSDQIDSYRQSCREVKEKEFKKFCPSTNTDWVKRLYQGLMIYSAIDTNLSIDDRVDILNLSRSLSKTGRTRYCQFDWEKIDGGVYIKRISGLQTILQALAKKSIDKEKDLFRYAYFYSPQIDEAQATDFWAIYETLNASQVLENSKKATEIYINNYIKTSEKSKSDSEFIAQLKESLNNICFLVTNSPVDSTTTSYTENYFHIDNAPSYLSMLNHGLEYMGLEKLSQDYFDFNIFTSDSIKYYSSNVESNHTLKSFCPLFNDFSNMEFPYCAVEGMAKDYDAAMAALKRPDMHLWWYSCNSHMNSALAGYNIDGNHGKQYGDSGEKGKKDVNKYGNSLAIARANKWQQFVMGIEGELYWAVDEYKDDEDDSGYNHNVWTKTTKGSPGNDGVLVYPIYSLLKHTYKFNVNYDNYAGTKFASSIRLENLSEANDDYDYLCLAEQKVMEHPEYRKQLENIIAKVIEPGNVNYTDPNLTNSENLAEARDELARLIVNCTPGEQTPKTESYTIQLSDEHISDVVNWNKSGKMLCVDVYESAPTYETSIVLKNNNDEYLSDKIILDFSTKTVSGCEKAVLTSKGNGWYTVQIPLNEVNPVSEEMSKKTLSAVLFQTGVDSLRATNLHMYQEVTKEGSGNTYFLSDASLPNVENWNSSNKILCFDVSMTGNCYTTDRQKNVLFSLLNVTEEGKWRRLNQYINIDFARKTISNCQNAKMIYKANNWYTIQIPLNNVGLNTDKNEESNGTETFYGFHFKNEYVNTSFLVDNINIYHEVTKEGSGNTYFLSDASLPNVENWSSSNKTLCFDVSMTGNCYTTDRQKNVLLSLLNVTEEGKWKRLNQYINIDFARKTISNCQDAKMIYKANNWYTIQVPLKNVTFNTDDKNDYVISGNEMLSGFHFKSDTVDVSFIVDNIRLLSDASSEINNIPLPAPPRTKKIYGDLNGDDNVDLSDLTRLSQYLLRDITLTDPEIILADVTGNDSVGIEDLALLKQYIMKDNVKLGPDK